MATTLKRGFPLTSLNVIGCSLLLLTYLGQKSLAHTIGGSFELLSYQSLDYKFQTIPLTEEPPAGYETLDFDDSGFQLGGAPFGGGSGGAGTDCPLRSTVQTEWPTGSKLLVRRPVFIPKGATNVRIMISVDNDLLAAFFNGSPIIKAPIKHDECPNLDDFRIDIPSHLIHESENNLLAFLVRDRPLSRNNETFFDVRVLSNLSTDALTEAFDTAATSSLIFPREPVSNVRTACNFSTDSPEISITFVADRTKEAGQIILSESRTGQRAISYSFAGALMLRSRTAMRPRTGMTGVESEGAQILQQRLAQNENDPALPALASALTRPSVQQDIHNCLKQVYAMNPCSRQCELINDVATSSLLAGSAGFCGIITSGAGAIGFGVVAEVPVAGWAVGVLGLSYCAFDAFATSKQLKKWDRWEGECKACCDKGCPTEICTSNQPRVSRTEAPPGCDPPNPR